MSELWAAIDWTQMAEALKQTLYMSFVSLFYAVIGGTLVGIALYLTQPKGLHPNAVIYRILDIWVNLFRSIPFIILMIIMFPLTKILVGSILGMKAAIPALVLSAVPFFARLTMIAFNEVDKGTIEAVLSMGASTFDVLWKVLLPEAAPALVSAIAVTGINLVGYTSMAGAIGSGGLGNLAYLYGFARRNNVILFFSTAVIVLIVFLIQFVGDFVSRLIDKR
ncbi:MAG: ABC transporter permease [Erysipelotrichaceae bacterium]|jgi:D-methionine transport system permease protein|nr:ABC transporter permease [Erysipelotrichaceae bacterium]